MIDIIYQRFVSEIKWPYRSCMNRLIESMPNNITYSFDNKFSYFNNCDIRGSSDVERIELLYRNPNGMWADCDILPLCNEIYLPEKSGKPYLFNCNGKPDVQVIIGNGCKKVFGDILEKIKNGSIHIHAGWLQKYISYGNIDCYIIPNGYYDHLSLGMMMSCTGWKEISNGICTMKNDNGKISVYVRGKKLCP
jgi:hypothetical protein